MAENEELRRSNPGTPQPFPLPTPPSQPSQTLANDESGVQNLLVDEQARFSRHDGMLSIYVAEDKVEY